VDTFQDELGSATPHLPKWLPHRRKRRQAGGGIHRIVEADNRQLFRDFNSTFAQSLDCLDIAQFYLMDQLSLAISWQ